jgi:hypothetical protein
MQPLIVRRRAVQIPNSHIEGNEPLLTIANADANKAIADEIFASASDAEAPDDSEHAIAYAAARCMLLAERQQVPYGKVAVLLGLFGLLLFTQTAKDAVACGHAMYWLLVFSIIPAVIALMYFVRPYLINKALLKHEVRSQLYTIC